MAETTQAPPTTNTNGKSKQAIDRFEDIVHNALSARMGFLNKFLDPRRDLDKACGYPDTSALSPQEYKKLYDRHSIAARVVEVFPKESWQVQPTVYENEDEDTESEFELAWKELGKKLRGKSKFQDEEGSPVWEYLRRADILSGIGHFGVILLGFSDGKPLHEPLGMDSDEEELPNPAELPQLGTDAQYLGTQFAEDIIPPKEGELELVFIRCFSEDLVQVVQYESNLNHFRFGQPVRYSITLNDPKEQHTGVGLSMATVYVHWTRVIHLADVHENPGSSEIFAPPRMRPVVNNLLDLAKLYGGSAEMYWRGAFPGLSLETHPALGGDVDIDKATTRSELENYWNDLQRSLVTSGMTVKTLAPTVSDPKSQIDAQIQAICIKKAVPQRVFMGSERGELASSQDDAAWNDRLRERQKYYITPRIIVPFIDRLIQVGALPEPEGYSVDWPDLTSQTAQEAASVAVTLVDAMAKYLAGGVEALIPPLEFLTRFMELTKAEAESIIKAAEEHMVEIEEQEMEKQAKMIEEGLMADPTQPPPGSQPGGGGPPGFPPKAPSGKGGGQSPPFRPKLAATAG